MPQELVAPLTTTGEHCQAPQSDTLDSSLPWTNLKEPRHKKGASLSLKGAQTHIELCTEPNAGEGSELSPIRFSRSAASLGVALGRIPGSLKLVWSRQLMTKKKRTAAMMGMARVR